MSPSAEGLAAYGSFFECGARALHCDSEAEACERVVMHLLRLTFPAARHMGCVRDVLTARALAVAPAAMSHPALALLWEKAAAASAELPPAGEMAQWPRLVKALVLRFAAYHHGRSERVCCVRTAAQLLADLLDRPVGLLWCSPAAAARAQATWFWPIERDGYLTLDVGVNAVRVCCQRDRDSGAAVFALLDAQPPATPRDAPLRLLRNSEDELSMEDDDDAGEYALWCSEASGADRVAEPVAPFCDCGGGVFRVHLPRAPRAGQLFVVYPGNASHSLLPPFPEGWGLHIFAEPGLQYRATAVAHDVYTYFSLAPEARSVAFSMARTHADAAAVIAENSNELL